MTGGGGLLAGAVGKRLGIDLAAIRSAGFGPAGRILLQNGDGKFRAALAIAGEETFGIGHRRDGSAGGKNAGGGLLIFLREFRDFGDLNGAILRGGAGGSREIARGFRRRLRTRDLTASRIFWLS